MLAGGVSLMIFPEGTRSDQGLGPLKKGGFMVALDSGLPILPVSIRGSEKVLPNKTVKIMPGVVELVVHPAIDPQTYGHEGRDQLMHDVRSAIASGLGDQS
jgi:1-acyl-sn-glycerol-3-phosphate acyltransferase